MSRKTIGKLTSTRLAFVETLQSVFGAMAGSPLGERLTPEERLELRAANDAAQR